MSAENIARVIGLSAPANIRSGNLFVPREEGDAFDQTMTAAEAQFLDERKREAQQDAADEAQRVSLIPYTEGQPPSAEELGIDVAGLPERRAMLVCFCGWSDATRKRLDDLRAGRAAYLEKIGVPALTKEKIEAIIARDKLGILSFMRSRGEGLTAPQIHAFEKKRLAEKLAGDEYEATVARDALAEADAEIAFLEQAVEKLEGRHQHFVQMALIDEAEALGQDYVDQVAALNTTLRRLLGLGAVVGGLDGYYRAFEKPQFSATLPRFNLKAVPGSKTWPITLNRVERPELKVAEQDAEAEGKVWRALEKRLQADPRATLKGTD